MADRAANDPDEFAEPPACPRCGGGPCRCPAGKCHGTRYVEVQPGYAEQEYPEPDADTLAAMSQEQRDLALWQLHLLRTAAANTVYPCSVCAPTQFYRWVGKHFTPDHDRGACDECIEALGGRKVRQLSHAGIGPRRAVFSPPERRDTDQ